MQLLSFLRYQRDFCLSLTYYWPIFDLPFVLPFLLTCAALGTPVRQTTRSMGLRSLYHHLVSGDDFTLFV